MRLSREDKAKEESDSIVNQKTMLHRYVEEKPDLNIFDFYIDDGFSGTNFERPEFKRMIKDIEEEKVNCVIVKDLSRFGRDYIGSGHYIERFFVDHSIRFIALNDGIDSLNSQYDLLMPIKNIFNQQYALDISRKVQSALRIKQREGHFIGAFPCYGYKRSTVNRHSLIVDEKAAETVRRIFQLYCSGLGKLAIARKLNEEGIACPSEYKKECGMNYHNSNRLEGMNYWTYSTIHHILQNQMYLGDMVQGKTRRRMKGKPKYLPQKEWIIVKQQHPAIIDESIWEQVQKNLKSDARNIDFKSNRGMFAGFLKCGDCNRSLAKNINLGQIHYVCAGYKNYGKKACSAHRINQKILEDIILEDLNTLLIKQDLKSLLNEVIEELEQSQSFNVVKRGKQIDIELQKLHIYKKKCYQDYMEELITKEEYIDYKDCLEAKVKALNKEKERFLIKGQKQKEEMLNLLKYDGINFGKITKLSRRIILEMVERVYIYDNKKIKIIYKSHQ